MFDLEIYRQHWMFLSISLGAIAMLSTVLWYLAVWRERGAEKQARIEITSFSAFVRWFQLAFPWILILTMIGTILFSIIYPQVRAIYPPNW
jgi:hypothetical protein